MMSLDRWIALAVTGVVLFATAATTAFVQDTTEYVVVTRFGEPRRTSLEPGLRLRWPLGIERVDRISNRLHLLIPTDSEYLTGDPKNLIVSSFLLWRVSDPLVFLQSVGDLDGAEARLAYLLSSELGILLGNADFATLINTDGDEDGLQSLSDSLRQRCATSAADEYGIEVVDVGIRRLGFPERNRTSVFERMRAERRRIAVKHRSEGEEAATLLRTQAELERSEILAQAEQDAATIRGQAEAEAARIYGEAHRANPGFYEFLRTLEAYDTILDDETTLVLPADAGVFDLLMEGP
jgi:modulator of FtsH protease HflC